MDPSASTSKRRQAFHNIALTIVGACTAILSFSGLHDLALECGYGGWLAILYPITVDAAAATGAIAWLRGLQQKLARRLTLTLLTLSVVLNSIHHVLGAYSLATPWWLVALVGAIPPAVLGAVSHLYFRIQEQRQDERLVTDLDAAEEAAGVPVTSAVEFPATLYRLWGTETELLYVGITSVPVNTRLAAHRRSQEWWGEVANVTVEEFPKRTEALAAERLAIAEESPKYNKQSGSAGDHVTLRNAAAGRRISPTLVPAPAPACLDMEEKARELVAGGAGRGTVMKELGLTDHQARTLLGKVKAPTNGQVVA